MRRRDSDHGMFSEDDMDDFVSSMTSFMKKGHMATCAVTVFSYGIGLELSKHLRGSPSNGKVIGNCHTVEKPCLRDGAHFSHLHA